MSIKSALAKLSFQGLRPDFFALREGDEARFGSPLSALLEFRDGKVLVLLKNFVFVHEVGVEDRGIVGVDRGVNSVFH